MIVLTNPLGGPPAIHAISLDSDPVWNSLPLTGEVPLVLGYSIVSLYDSEADRMVVLDEWTGRLWSVSLGMSPLEWAQLPNPPGGPTLVHAAFLDPLRRRIVAFGQTSGLPRLPMQTWFYDLDSALGWTPSPFSGAPPYGREGNSVIYDPVFDRAVLFGGFIPGFDWGMIDAVFSDTWSFFLGAPTQEVAIDVKPGDRANLIPIRSKGVMEVAILGSSSFNPDSIVASSVTLAGASIRSRGNADPTILWRDVNRDGFIDLVLGVEADEVRLGPADTLAVLRGMTTGGGRIVGFDRVRPVPGTRREAPNVAQAQFGLSLRPSERFRPGEVLAFHYSLPMPISARMELMDIMGRRLALRELPGASQVGELELTETRHLPAGLYFVRLSQARQQVTLRVVIMR